MSKNLHNDYADSIRHFCQSVPSEACVTTQEVDAYFRSCALCLWAGSEERGGDDEHRVEWEEIRREGDEEVRLREPHAAARRRHAQFRGLCEEQEPPQRMRQFVREHIRLHWMRQAHPHGQKRRHPRDKRNRLRAEHAAAAARRRPDCVEQHSRQRPAKRERRQSKQHSQ